MAQERGLLAVGGANVVAGMSGSRRRANVRFWRFVDLVMPLAWLCHEADRRCEVSTKSCSRTQCYLTFRRNPAGLGRRVFACLGCAHAAVQLAPGKFTILTPEREVARAGGVAVKAGTHAKLSWWERPVGVSVTKHGNLHHVLLML